MGGDANGNYCSLMAVTIHLRQLLFIMVDCIVDYLGGGLHGWSCSKAGKRKRRRKERRGERVMKVGRRINR